MEPNVFDKFDEIDLKKTMENSYIDYAMSVIASRALPDVRDGLKPVQRRVLFSMIELNNTPDKPHRKCARIVGDTMGKYHPHGDSSIYGALVNMAQSWSMRYPLVDGHGNFGSVDGDGAAAMRYTEARLSKIAMEMLSDIGKDTVNFTPNFDETEKEPSVLPSRFPNLLVNGTTGIAVGMTTNIPPHNLREVISAVDRIIDNRIADKETVLDDILKIVKGPDFPTGAMILGSRGIKEAYKTGRGKVKVRGISSIEQMPNGKSRIIISELPYLVNKARLIEKIAELVKDKKIDGITDLRDESNREGMRIVIELRKDVNSNVILNRLYKHTQLQDTFGIIMLALVDNQPKILNLQQMLELYIKHQEDVISRRTAYDLKKAEERAHILEGLLKALDHIDEIIKIIRSSQNIAEAKEKLIERFEFSQIQAQAICEMRLRSLTGLERNRLENEYDELKIKIKLYKEILSDNKKLLGVIKEEINIIAGNFGDDRKTVFGQDDEFSDEDLIPVEDTVIAMTKLGYIKRMSPDNFKSQNRGGKGIKAMQTIEEDFIEDIIMTNTHKDINFFTNLGKVYRLKAYRIPEAGRTARGNSIVNLLKLDPGESVTAIIPNEENDRFKYFIMATRKGMVKKTHISEYENVRANGLTAIALNEDDELIEVKAANGDDHVVLVTKNAKCIVFHETEIRITGRKTLGVRGIRLSGDDVVIGMQMKTQGETLLVVSEYGMGKRTSLGEFRGTHRGNKGLACYKLTEKSGCLVGAKLVDDDREIFIITNEGILIRIEVSKISNIGRVTSGVKLMNIDRESGIKVAGIAKVRETNRDDEDEETGAAQNKE
ncbi:A subunit [Johnsonella ignava ATCC 51276]|uniref:DNA gyrase subunit A n=1 Tax=Johnsonella ignava ATCC 51276 TaxID=679200 RepID=G5GKD9_9FIRM|nr:DNA gyrase subunit A [Johnsonella ignava]EHI54829.1 A subunit [Johnsonella ignava ATCC 51276]